MLPPRLSLSNNRVSASVSFMPMRNRLGGRGGEGVGGGGGMG